jgi:hypothetical protein
MTEKKPYPFIKGTAAASHDRVVFRAYRAGTWNAEQCAREISRANGVPMTTEQFIEYADALGWLYYGH